MIDIHTHILYGVDDGSPDIETSKYLVEEEVQNGVTKIVLTPHQNEENKNGKDLKELFIKFKEEFKEYPIEFYLGSEIYYYPNMINDLNEGSLLSFNDTKYILVEFSTEIETDIPNIIYDLKLAGFKPIVAHIERYGYLNKNDYQDVKRNGGLIQINSNSFSRKYYDKTLKYLLKNDLVDFISSDCHNRRRNCDFELAKKFISKKYRKLYDKLFNDNFIFDK